VAIAALSLLSACGASTETSPSRAQAATPGVPASSTSTPDTAEPDVSLVIGVTDGEVTPAPDRFLVSRGDRVRITVNSDAADAVHLHGYDIEKPVRPENPAVLVFEADQPGLFELETHEAPVLILAQFQVR
jgi:hypothetical protein